MLLADRFVRTRAGWFDLSTGAPVAVRVRPAGTLADQVAWADRCAGLLRLRHPLLNPLLDYGAADASTVFEAFAVRPPLVATPAAASYLAAHARRFLATEAISLGARLTRFLIRQVSHGGSSSRARPLGLRLQPRAALVQIAELFQASLPGGATSVALSGETGSGLRTSRLLVARAARQEGFVPVCPESLVRWPGLIAAVARRHVCVLLFEEPGAAGRAAAARLLAALAGHSARAHVCLRFVRAPRGALAAVHLDRLGTTAMTTMLHLDSTCGPAPDDVFCAARQSDGLPGRFLSALGSDGEYPPVAPRPAAVHETASSYVVAPQPAAMPQPGRDRTRRLATVLSAAAERARALEVRGRHAAAARLLARAAAALGGRGDQAAAARLWQQLAWLHRNRGRLDRSMECADRAVRVCASPAAALESGCIVAVCRTDAGRFAEAEAHLRTLLAGAAVIEEPSALRSRCALALARVVLRQGRAEEALSVLHDTDAVPGVDGSTVCEMRQLRSRAALRLGDVRAAMSDARAAHDAAMRLGDHRLLASSSRTLAEVLCEAGDPDGAARVARQGLAAAMAGRLPLAALELRLTLLAARDSVAGSTDAESNEGTRARGRLRRAAKAQLPADLRARIAAALATAPQTARSPAIQRRAGAILEDLLVLTHRAEDDGSAAGAVLEYLLERLGAASIHIAARDGRILRDSGSPWRPRGGSAAHALASGAVVPVDPSQQPAEAAHPIRYGDDVIAAVACRWHAGAFAGPDAAAMLRSAAIVLAGPVRAMLDAAPAVPPAHPCGDLLGDSDTARVLREAVQRAARAPFPVLVEGESGSGKELVARAIHKLSARHLRRFCAINCAALTDELVEAELFGHSRGAFTGAATERAGLFEEADGGTLFLDEIGELSPRAQAKLLRVLQEGEVRRVGENFPRRVDVRVVAATNRRLEQEVAAGRFRADLRFRLDVLRILVPPLRERVADIPVLAQHFWQQAAARVGSRASLGGDALAALCRYDWPGNVRELQNAIAWMAAHAPRRGRVGSSLLPARLGAAPLATGSFEAAREDFERRYVRAALAQSGGQRQAAARALGVSRQGLAKMLRRLGIDAYEIRGNGPGDGRPAIGRGVSGGGTGPGGPGPRPERG